jgi:ubiquinone/menaquinone biosynthesis C-methylase UbiE
LLVTFLRQALLTIFRFQPVMDFQDFYALFSAEPWSKLGKVPVKIAAELQNFSKHKTLLEVGTAEGYIIRQLVRNGVAERAVGYDISEKRLRKACMRAKQEGIEHKVSFTLGDGCSLPYDDQSFDVVLLPQVLEHVPTRDGVISLLHESARVSRNGLLVSLPLIDVDLFHSKYTDPDHIRGQIVYKNGWIYHAQNVERLFGEAGFSFTRSNQYRQFYRLKLNHR